MKKRIIGIDPGLLHTGWAIIDVAGSELQYVASGVVLPKPKDPLVARLVCIFDGINDVCKTFAPDECGIEITFVNKNPTSTLLLGHARAAAMVAIGVHDILVNEYEPNTIKKALTGRGHADKAQVDALVKILLPGANPKTADESDAIAIAITHANMSKSLLRMIQGG